MLKGFEWVVPVVVVVFWLITTILKNREREEPVRRKPGAADEPRKPTSDIDRFLQEIDKLRRKTEGEAEIPTVKPVPVALRQKPPRVRAVQRQQAESENVLVAQAVPVVMPVLTVLQQVAPTVPQLNRTLDQRMPPGATLAYSLLRSRQSLAGAMILKEVFGPPKCRQR